MKLVYSYIAGLVFGVGISISGMGNPAKVLNFFDIAGSWDPSLIFVMGGGLITALIGYRFVLAKDKPIADAKFHLPKSQIIDARLIGGSVIFGVGWGIAGFCPGGALPMIGTLSVEVLVFTAALISGILLAKWLQSARDRRQKPHASA